MRAFSKINLILDVLMKRPDGYHNLRSVMQTLALHDTVTITVEAETLIDNKYFNLTCNDPNLPTDDRNLVARAAKFIIQEYNISQPIRIHLEKRIPQAAGLAGGSSDCAATLVGLNNLFNLNIPLHSSGQCTKSLVSMGQRFGADVPFCLLGGTALAEGIGERLTPLTPHPHCWVVLACPDIPVSTVEVFNNWKPGITSPDNIPAMVQALSHGDLKKIAANFNNNLTQITTKTHPIILEMINEMKTQGALNAAMSGSGPTVFGYFDHLKSAKKAYKHIENIAGRAFLTEIRECCAIGG